MKQQTLSIEEALQLAQQWLAQQRFSDAEQLCQSILQVQPQQVDALHILAVIATHTGRQAHALEFVAQALALSPQQAMLWNTQGGILLALEQWEAAAQSFRRGLQQDPQSAALQRNLGLVFYRQKNYAAALPFLAEAVRLHPGFVEAWNNLGFAHDQLKNYDAAIAAWQNELRIKPSPQTHSLMATALFETQRYSAALTHIQTALQQLPATAPDKDSPLAELWVALWHTQGKLALTLGDAQTAAQLHQRVAVWMPHEVFYQQILLWTLNFLVSPPEPQVTQACRAFEAACQAACADLPALPVPQKHAHPRLRVGYVSADFRQHAVSFFMQPILAQHDRRFFEIYCYYNNLARDAQTAQLQSLVEHWVDCGQWSDAQMRQRIASDELDILVELSGMTDGNILPLMAQKIAPVQVSYLGYPGSSCLSSIDYRITDCYVHPQPSADGCPEQLWRLPFAYHCYQPPHEARDLAVAPLPAAHNGFITFASLNNYAKVSETIFALWVKVLQNCPNSRFVMQMKVLNDASLREQICQRFVAAGIAETRLTLLETTSSIREHLQVYHAVDMCLDTYPYNGGTTTCHALWMGVPTLSLCGKTQTSRMGYSILATAGLAEWVAFSAEEFIAKAQRFSADLAQLQQLRAGMRERLRASPLLDAAGFTRALEQAYQTMHAQR